MKSFKTHRFFCLKCGQEGIPLPRKQGHKHSKLHRKKIYCLNCKIAINHIECQSEEDIFEFKKSFNEGKYLDEVEESLKYSS